MKRLLSLLICSVMLFAFTGCKRENEVYDKKKIQIVATVFPLYDFARQVAGDKAQITLLLQPGVEAHSYEPTVQDIMKIRECDLFLNLGTNAEPWASEIINDSGLKSLNKLSAMDLVELYEQHDHSHSHESVSYDQHVWTSLKNAEKIVAKITDALCEADKENALYYRENGEKYCQEILELNEKFEKFTQTHREAVMVFADRFPFKYFAKEYSIDYYAAFPGCSSESEPSAADIARLVDVVKNNDIPIVFYTETSNRYLPDAICEETGAQARLFHSCHTVTKKELENGTTYIDIMNRNFNVLKEALE